MSFIYITGVSGTGKTTIYNELKNRGFEAYDVEEDGLARRQNKITGYIHPKSSVKEHQHTQEFLDTYSWIIPREYMEELAKKAKNKNVYLCGVFSNERDLSDLFDKVIALNIDRETLIHRLRTRTNNNFGKSEHELAHVIEWHKGVNKYYKEAGYIIIDSNRPLKQIIEKILSN